MIQALDHGDVLQLVAKLLGRPVMYVSGFERYEMEDCWKAAPYTRDMAEYGQIVLDGCGYLVFETEEEMEHYFALTIGDDGPTEANPYNGPARLYALTCGADGQLQNENT